MSEAELPEGWAVAKLGDGLIVDVQPGFACGAHSRGGTATIAHLRPMNVSVEGKIDLRDLKCVSEVQASRDERLVRQGDVLFNNTNSPALVGKTAYYSDSVPRAFSNHMTRLRTHPEALLPPYVALTLHYLWQVGYFESACNNHVSQASVGRNVLLGTEIPLPPVAEQRRIVEKVESLRARVQAVRERLARVPLLLKRVRQAVLAAACDGRLTADWRTRNPSEYSASLIHERRFELDSHDDELSEIPECWCWVPLGNYAKCSRGRFLVRPRNDPAFFDGPYPFIQIGNLNPEGGWVTSHSQTLNHKGIKVSKMFPRGTVAIAIVGATIGNTGLLGYDMCFTDSMVGIETATLEGNRFVELFLRHRKQAIRESSYSSGGQPNISLEVLNPYPLALPPLAEQCEIVRRVDALFKLADAIEAKVSGAAARADRLVQAILAKAFRGELVPTEAELARAEGRDYEPAATLLERIRATQPTAAPRASRRREAVPASESQHQRLERGRCVLDMLLLLDAWKKPVSIAALEPALVLMRNDVARNTLLAGKATKRRRKALQEPPQWITGLDGIYRALEQSNAIRRVGQHAYALVNPEPLNRATAADRARAAEVLRAIQKLADIRDLPQAVAAVTHERYEVTV